MSRFIALVVFAVLTFIASPARAATDPVTLTNAACASLSPAFTETDLTGLAAPCAAAPGTLLIETLYFQNASRMGGTALAAYPLVRLRTGLTRRLELVVDPPSQVAESGLRGRGLYPTTLFGYGLNYALTSSGRSASALGVELSPPSSRFTIDARQPKYIFDYTFGYKVGDRGTISAVASGASSRTSGFSRIAPAAAVRYAFDASAQTQLSTDIGERIVAHGAHAQTYTDFVLDERLRKNVTYTVGLGTAFNGIAGNGKAHYIASGFNFHLK